MWICVAQVKRVSVSYKFPHGDKWSVHARLCDSEVYVHRHVSQVVRHSSCVCSMVLCSRTLRAVVHWTNALFDRVVQSQVLKCTISLCTDCACSEYRRVCVARY